jgi:demethylmenaquinone methyltransferase/2-methoxy-6-polyprenyl-1,4-benzoquinol methylase
MFDRIAGRYDLLNRVMTMGVDKRWRRAAVKAARVRRGSDALDVCCGTGDITFLLAKAGARRAVGVDFSSNMLVKARERVAGVDPAVSKAVEFVQGDALDLPFADDSFDALTVSFGVRNVASLEQAFSEFRRVVRPGGRVVCLEITRPASGPAKAFYGLWFHRIVPVMGGVLGGDREAYTYLPRSTKAFPRPGRLASLMGERGLCEVTYRTFAGGIVALHQGTVPAAGSSD